MIFDRNINRLIDFLLLFWNLEYKIDINGKICKSEIVFEKLSNYPRYLSIIMSADENKFQLLIVVDIYFV